MKFPLKPKKKALSLFFVSGLLGGSFCFFSCSQSSSDILSVKATAVFEYEDENSLPKSSLSVFVQSEGEAQRADFLKITRMAESGENYGWTVLYPVTFVETDKNWVGYPVLMAAEGKSVENGEYEILYSDVAGNAAQERFSVKYSEKILTSRPEDVRRASGVNLSELLVLFDKNMNMLFYATPKRTWRTNANILKDYSRAVYKRRVLTDSSGSLIIKLPLEKLKENGEGND
ncbi:hypothetical protein [uncultured Treponema sp.]|uniref:hypothetical protein n=1 Tax=uncultured Treponema sp. TaxID=162155 RepID=UPI0015BA5279|nr:hypothetical protein [uncultured Treponema sp.]